MPAKLLLFFELCKYYAKKEEVSRLFFSFLEERIII